jgi:hypothetical protein
LTEIKLHDSALVFRSAQTEPEPERTQNAVYRYLRGIMPRIDGSQQVWTFHADLRSKFFDSRRSHYFTEAERSGKLDLRRIYAKGAGGNLAPLSEVGTWQTTVENKIIYHRQLQARAPSPAIALAIDCGYSRLKA